MYICLMSSTVIILFCKFYMLKILKGGGEQCILDMTFFNIHRIISLMPVIQPKAFVPVPLANAGQIPVCQLAQCLSRTFSLRVVYQPEKKVYESFLSLMVQHRLQSTLLFMPLLVQYRLPLHYTHGFHTSWQTKVKDFSRPKQPFFKTHITICLPFCNQKEFGCQ